VDVNVKNGYTLENFEDSVLADHMSVFRVQAFLRFVFFFLFVSNVDLLVMGFRLQ
jgi:hypothetical protein